MTNLENLKKLAEGLGADASKSSTNLSALNVISKALGGSGDAQTNAEAIFDIVGASLDEMASPAMLKGIIDRTVTEVVIPEGTTEIGSYSLYSCTNLENVQFPTTVSTVKNNAFAGCTSLKAANFLEGVESIGASAFGGCMALETVTLPNSVHSIASSAFGGCAALKSFKVTEGSSDNVTIPENATGIKSNTISSGTMLETIEIPAAIAKIEAGAFAGATNVKTIKLSAALHTIHNVLGGNNTSLTTVTTSYGAEVSTPDDAVGMVASFAGCSALTYAEIPDAITTIGDSAFAGCTKLEAVVLPKNLKEIARDSGNPFAGCPLKSMKTRDNQDSEFDIDFPDGFTTLCDLALAGASGFTSVHFPSTTASIGASAFGGVSTLTKIVIDKPENSIEGAPWGATNATVNWLG
ncbi:MAG: leucine-rich repeat domain-containing protein [Ruminococcus sp.]|nr:leucine-rich repeat domain-containing protein [Ruminococcus sp.]